MTTTPRTLLRTLGLVAAASIIVTNMIGQGVYLKARVMICEVATTPAMIAAWVVAGALALCGALALAELGAAIPESGGIYAFLRRAYGEAAAFAFGWMTLFIGAPAAIGALGSGAAIFFDRLSGGALDGHALGIAGTQWFALALIAVVTLINCAPAALNGGVATGFALLKIATIVGIAAAGLLLGHREVAQAAAAGPACTGVAAATRGGAAGFAAALIAALYAYNGWHAVTLVAGEVRAPQRTIPRALGIGVGLVAVLYVFANVAFARVLGPAAIAALPASASVGVATVEALFGPAWGAVSSLLLFLSAAATLHVVVLSYARVTHALAADGALFAPLARLSRHGVPVRAVLATSAIAALLVLVANFDALSDYYVFNLWVFFVAAVVALFVLRRREPALARSYRVTGYPFVPALFVLVALWVLVQTLVASPRNSLVGLAIVALAFPVYAWRRRRAQPWEARKASNDSLTSET
ncbi:MAG TPA: APC family permease [Candidatus Limnocylindria bacterium]|nr:APC family permease [Candidatus Limnocylindria bacterium]